MDIILNVLKKAKYNIMSIIFVFFPNKKDILLDIDIEKNINEDINEHYYELMTLRISNE